jgi:ferrous iron transport protein B
MPVLNVALAGNPNTGKTTLFNALTGAQQRIGNWPGVTVEKVVGQIKKGGKVISIVDLPGTYTLAGYSLEEKIVVDYITGEKPDLVVNVVDASNLERNLYLTIQLIELGHPLLVILNMIDEAQGKGFEIDTQILSHHLGVPVLATIASRKDGVQQLLEQFDVSIQAPQAAADSLLPAYLERFRALSAARIEEAQIEARYDFIGQIVEQAVKKVSTEEKGWSEKLDDILTNRLLGIPIFLAIMYLLFELSFSWVGSPLSDLLDVLINEKIAEWTSVVLTSAGVADWLNSLLVDGVIAGVGSVLVFVPIIFTLFLLISFIEGTGYMARGAFIMDQVMRRLGLSGKAFLPILMGFGCSVPAIMGARILDTERDRRVTVLITPLMSCSARLPVYALLASVFFVGKETQVIFSLYLLGIVIAILMGILLKSTILKGESEPLIMELPPYRMPALRTVILQTWERGKGFLVKAGTIIFSMSVLLWFVSSYNLSGPAEIQDSLAAAIGSAIAPLFSLHGFAGWESGVALLTGIMAKEAVVSTMAIVYGAGELVNETPEILTNLQTTMNSVFTPLSAYAFLVFTLLYTPCMAALAAIKKELSSWKWTLFAAGYPFVLAWTVSLIIYQVGLLLGWGG